MDAAVFCASVYGSSERYAREFPVRKGFSLRKLSDEGNLVPFDTVSVFASMYSGKLLFLKQILPMVPKRQQLVIVTVGLSDVRDPESTDWIMKCLSKKISSKRMDRIDFFHLRGAIGYENLSFIHKLKTVFLYSR